MAGHLSRALPATNTARCLCRAGVAPHAQRSDLGMIQAITKNVAFLSNGQKTALLNFKMKYSFNFLIASSLKNFSHALFN